MHKFAPAQKAYLTQYISLMLIILSCLIGAANGKEKVSEEVVPEKQPAGIVAASNPDYLKSEIELKNIFDSETGVINAQELEAFKDLIDNHDLNLELKIVASDRVGAKVAQLSRILREQGFLKGSYTVTGVRDLSSHKQAGNDVFSPQENHTHVKARFERSQS